MTRCQALIPQLMHPLHPVPYKKPRITLQLSSLRALETVIQECPSFDFKISPVIKPLTESEEELRHALRAVCAGLLEVAPSARKVSSRILLWCQDG